MIAECTFSFLSGVPSASRKICSAKGPNSLSIHSRAPGLVDSSSFLFLEISELRSSRSFQTVTHISREDSREAQADENGVGKEVNIAHLEGFSAKQSRNHTRPTNIRT